MSSLPEDTRSNCTLAFVVASIFAGFIGVFGALGIMSIAFEHELVSRLNFRIFEFQVSALDTPAKILAAIYIFIGCGVLVSVFVKVARLFYELRSGPVLSEQLPVNVKRVGRSLVWLGIVMALSPVAQAIFSWSNGQSASIDITPDPATILAFLLGLMLTTLARVLHDAVEIELENRQFI